MRADGPAGRDRGASRAHHDQRQGRAVPARPGQPPVPRASGRTSCGSRTSPTSRPGRASSTSPSSSTSTPGASSAGASAGRRMPSFVLDALEQALHDRRPAHRGGLVHHSDRGSQYVSIQYTERLAEAGIEPSVGSVGDSYDNALAETINGLYKTEVIHRRGPWRIARSRRVRHPRMGRLVQPSPAARAHRQHPARRGRRALLRQLDDPPMAA